MTKQYVYYPNRKIYSKDKAAYATLKDIVADVREGVEVVVTCRRTKLDISERILTQALLEHVVIPKQTALMLLRDNVN